MRLFKTPFPSKPFYFILVLTLLISNKSIAQNASIDGPLQVDLGAEEYYEAHFDYLHSYSNISWNVSGGTIISQGVNPTSTIYCIVQWDNSPGDGSISVYEDLYSQYTERTVRIGEVCQQANAGSDVALCQGNSTTIGSPGVSGYTYSWFPTTGLSNPNIAQPTATPSQTTKYTLTVTPQSNLLQMEISN